MPDMLNKKYVWNMVAHATITISIIKNDVFSLF